MSISQNPLFPATVDDGQTPPPRPNHTAKPLQPLSPDLQPLANQSAANVIRQKLTALYASEPAVQPELPASHVVQPRSPHQQFIYDLQNSGQNLAEIQTAWHNYYVKLPDEQKHAVWHEFYEAQAQVSHYQQLINHPPQATVNNTIDGAVSPAVTVLAAPRTLQPRRISDRRRPAAIKSQLLATAQKPSHRRAIAHLKSLGFGLAMGVLVLIVFLFGFFNQIIIAPFIQPSRHVGNAPLIVEASTVSATATPEVIIPKINVDIPVNYNLTTDDENVIENALEGGVVHYPSTVMPGQNGNAAFFGHSSNNIFNPGQYKFAFVLLHTLVKGDTFYLTYNNTVYVYQVVARRIVSPDDVAVLNQTEGYQATATLITCDPPGTSNNRLVVTGKQISPSPTGNTASAPQIASQPSQLASNGPSLWSRFTHWLF